MKRFITCIFVSLIPVIGFSKTIHVPSDYPKIQQAINAASDGDTVLVEPGTYKENLDFSTKAIALMSSSGPEVTVIDGMQKKHVIYLWNCQGPLLAIEGFTITNGKTVDYPCYDGAGIHCAVCSPVIRNNIIIKNSSDYRGGGIYLNNSNALIADNVVSRNYSYYGTAGIDCFNSSSTIDRNFIVENTGGSGINCSQNSNAIISNNIILNNQSAYNGGGISTDSGSSPLIFNNVIAYNTTSGRGGGIAFWDGASPVLNNTIYGNTADVAGGGIAAIANTDPEVKNTILWNNQAPLGPEIAVGNISVSTLTISYSDVEGGSGMVYVTPVSTLNWGVGMIDADPLFIDPVEMDFHISHASPCRNTGESSAPSLPPEDFEGDPRIHQGMVDMGADEFHTHLYHVGEAVPGGKVNVKVIGVPGTSPVGLFVSSQVLDPPLWTAWGYWYLDFPVIGPLDLGSLPHPHGVIAISGDVPHSPPGPYSVPLQALVGNELTNLCSVAVH